VRHDLFICATWLSQRAAEYAGGLTTYSNVGLAWARLYRNDLSADWYQKGRQNVFCWTNFFLSLSLGFAAMTCLRIGTQKVDRSCSVEPVLFSLSPSTQWFVYELVPKNVENVFCWTNSLFLSLALSRSLSLALSRSLSLALSLSVLPESLVYELVPKR